jgi:hypothetical protein
MLRTDKGSQAEQAVKQLSDLTVEQLCGLADLFLLVGRDEFGNSLYELARQREQPTGEALAHLIFRQVQYYPKGRRRWELLLEAANALPAESDDRWLYWRPILDEAESAADAALLGEFAATQHDREFQSDLRLRQAELADDPKVAGDIAEGLSTTQRLLPFRLLRVLELLEEADRWSEIVRLIEDQLRRREPLTLDMQQRLIKAYTKLGDSSSALRATSDTLSPPRPVRPGPGSGLF